jgi:hypothetical protein
VKDKWAHSAAYFRERRLKARLKRDEEGTSLRTVDPLYSAIVRQRGQELTMMMRTPVCLWPPTLLDDLVKKPRNKCNKAD